ncbi:AbiTii domain-containing protein [Pandoraea soli]
MPGLVEELQRKALDRTCSIADLLRHALLTARKLKVASTAAWIDAELNGYGFSPDVPDYRILYGQPLAKSPFQGWIPVRMPNAELTIKISQINLGHRIAEVDASVDQEKGAHMAYSFPTEKAYVLRNILATDWELCIKVPKSSVSGILDQVRSKILEWAIALEESGVRGEGLSFSDQEVEAARGVVTFVTNNNYSNINHSQIQHHSNGSSQTLTISAQTSQDMQALVAKLREGVKSAEIEAGLREDLLSDLDTAELQLASKKAKPGIVRAALESFSSTLASNLGGAIAGNAHDWALQAGSWISNALDQLGHS